jgi:hypothetical protein
MLSALPRVQQQRQSVSGSESDEPSDAPAGLAAQDVFFTDSGCDIICIGTRGEFVVLDALSAAASSSMLPCLQQCTAIATGLKAETGHANDILMVDADGQVR